MWCATAKIGEASERGQPEGLHALALGATSPVRQERGQPKGLHVLAHLGATSPVRRRHDSAPKSFRASGCNDAIAYW